MYMKFEFQKYVARAYKEIGRKNENRAIYKAQSKAEEKTGVSSIRIPQTIS